MKINLIDDTALIETTSIKKGRTILGLHHNASNSNVHEEIIKTSSGSFKTHEPMFVNNKKRTSRPHVCGNVRMNQENGNVSFTERVKFQENGNLGFHVDGCGKKKVILGCAGSILNKQESFDGNGCEVEGRLMCFIEGEKNQESEDVDWLKFKNFQENGNGRNLQERKFRENENVGGCAGNSFKKQESYDGNGFEEEEKMMGFLEKVKIQENENLGFDTNQEKVSTRNCCLIGVGNITGNEKGMLGFDRNLEKIGKTIQVWVARGKVQDKYETTFKDDKVSTIEMVEVQSGNGSGKKIVGTTICYSRKQMEDLRFVNIEDQNKKWGAIYCKLGPAVKKEYDGLLDCNYHHHPQLDFKKKVTAHGILGPMTVNGSWNRWYLCAPKKGLK